MKVRLWVAYDGMAFCGWQSQKIGKTVQDTLEAAIAGIVGERVIVHGAGRTDSGVHGLEQSLHFELTPEQIARIGRMSDISLWVPALNASLPPEVRILKSAKAKSNFHARFSASSKIYRYEIWNAPVLPPHFHHRAWHIHQKLDYFLFSSLARMIEGSHDFRGFCASSGSQPQCTIRTIYCISLRKKGSSLSITIQGDGFLYRMVRMLVGGMVRVAAGKEPLELFHQRLVAGNPCSNPPMAPPWGLYLVKVLYSHQGQKN